METILSIIAAVFFIVEAIGILAAFHAVLYTKTSQGAIAWGISLVTFPWMALPFMEKIDARKLAPVVQ